MIRIDLRKIWHALFLLVLTVCAAFPTQAAAPDILWRQESGGGPIMFSPSGRYVAVGGAQNTAHVFNSMDGTDAGLFHSDTQFIPASRINSLAFSPDERLLVTGHGEPKQIFYFGPPPPELAEMVYTQDNFARVWDIPGGKWLHDLPHEGPVNAVDVAPDGQTIATGSGTFISGSCSSFQDCVTTTSADNAVRLWRVSDGKLDKVLALNQASEVTAIAYSPEGNMIASGNADGSIQLWRVSDGEKIRTIDSHAGTVDQIVFTSDGAVLRARFGDGDARSWRVSDGEPLGLIMGRSNALSPDGAFVAHSVDAFTKLQIHRMDDGQLVKVFDEEVAGGGNFAFSRDGRYFGFSRSDGQMFIANLHDPPTIKGDVNGDDAVAVLDAIEALKILTGLVNPNTDQRTTGDVNGDGTIDISDVILILQVAVGMRLDFESHPPQSDDFFTGLKAFWKSKQPAGAIPLPAPSVVSPDWGLLTLTSTDNDVWLGTWEPFFVYQDGIYGDFTMRVLVHGVPECGKLSAAGLMVAQGVPDRIEGPASIPAWGSVQATRDYGVEAKWGGKGGSETSFPGTMNSTLKPPYWLRLDRQGQTLSFYVSRTGEIWGRLGDPVDMAARGFALRDPVSAGIVEQTHCGSETPGTAVVAQFQAGPIIE